MDGLGERREARSTSQAAAAVQGELGPLGNVPNTAAARQPPLCSLTGVPPDVHRVAQFWGGSSLPLWPRAQQYMDPPLLSCIHQTLAERTHCSPFGVCSLSFLSLPRLPPPPKTKNHPPQTYTPTPHPTHPPTPPTHAGPFHWQQPRDQPRAAQLQHGLAGAAGERRARGGSGVGVGGQTGRQQGQSRDRDRRVLTVGCGGPNIMVVSRSPTADSSTDGLCPALAHLPVHVYAVCVCVCV